MLSNMKKIKMNGKMCDVATLENYTSNRDVYIQGSTVIETDGYVLPMKPKFDEGVGIYVGSTFSYPTYPSENEKEKYSLDNAIDMSNVKDIGELMKKQEAVRDLEKEVLTNPDDICIPVIGEKDTPAMKALKMAVLDKHMDINKYAHRFGANFNNDKRNLNKESISLPMLERMCSNLDIKATLILEDANSNVSNPIGRSIVVELTGEGEDD